MRELKQTGGKGVKCMRTIKSLDELEMPTNHKIYLRHLLGYLGTYSKIDKILLFGSCAKGTATSKSDIDLFLLGAEINDQDEFDIAWDCPKWEGGGHISCDILSNTHETYAAMSKVPGMVQYSIELRGVDLSGLLQAR